MLRRLLLPLFLTVATMATIAPAEADAADPATLVDEVGNTVVDLVTGPARADDRFGPGSLLFVDAPPGQANANCTAGFVFRDASRTYLSTAGHCLLPEGAISTHGIDADHDPSDWRVLACVASCHAVTERRFVVLGEVRYARQGDPTRATGDDAGLVEVPAALLGNLEVDVARWGGPTAARAAVPVGAACVHGWTSDLGDDPALRARAGTVVLRDRVRFASLIPVGGGDSGAAVVHCAPGLDGLLRGRAALGILTHLTAQDGAGGTTVDRIVELVRRDADLQVTLATV